MPTVKVELHSHTSDDPEDAIGYSARDLIDRAADLGYGALAITLHDRHFEDPATTDYARRRGLTLIPSIERTIERCHILLVNVPAESERTSDFESVRRLKARHPEGLVIAPHPWFPLGSSLGERSLNAQADLWDAVEISAFYTRLVNYNTPVHAWARTRGVPVVGNGDVHQLRQLGTTFSLVDVDGPVTSDAICEAIRAGRVRVESRPLTHVEAARIALRAILGNLTGRAW